ncbi:hypothetical protein HXX76_004366 [Chlamydomonas incerta]|uniref:Uncharacterized protein n=1 Tax=Chlamydomonas incerta TaxID=51695 RepID=A0A835TH64_CHLIN|nr:hypothetical protein HXX76_004366 [Chlamydomonas incerta]|eukprot:KAG2440254.1 hypothetical protein HXX76_004366 [Chlamydomonas incerta]
MWKGDQLWGTIEVLPTPSGLLLWELYSRGVKLGVSSRGWASLRSDPASKCVFVDDDFELITFDFVTEPSTRGAYLAPVQKKYKRPVPDQSKVMAISHLGHGVVAMEKVSRVPGPAVLVQRIAELQRVSAAALNQLSPPGAPLACGPGVLQQAGAPPSFKPSGLDNLLCYGHYVVHQSAPYLDREQHARDYRAHLVIFTARAHLADERLNTGTLSRSDIDNVILNKLVTKDSFDPASTSFATRLDQPPHFGAGAGGGGNGVMHAAMAAAMAADGVGMGAGGGLGGMMVASTAAAAAAAETQGPPGIDASYAVVHAAAAARQQGGAPGDLESWAMHPHVLNASPHGSPGVQPGSAPGAGGLKIMPVVIPPGGVGPGKAGSGRAPGGGYGGGADEDALRAWLSQLPGGDAMAQGFLEIRSSLISFAQLYALHQKRVEAALLKQVQGGQQLPLQHQHQQHGGHYGGGGAMAGGIGAMAAHGHAGMHQHAHHGYGGQQVR